MFCYKFGKIVLCVYHDTKLCLEPSAVTVKTRTDRTLGTFKARLKIELFTLTYPT